MKAILEYDLNDFDERREHMIALKGRDMLGVLYELSNHLRYEIRKNESNSDEDIAIYEKIQNKFYEWLLEENISIDQLYQ